MWTAESLQQFEEDIKECYLKGEIKAPIHLSGGNERQLLSIFKDVKPEDWCFSTYRSHLHALLKGISADWLKQEILAGRSMHINSKEHRFMTSSIAGGCLPIALGVALAIKMKGEDRKVWCFVGCMAAEMGIAHECIKYARNHNLPLCMVVEDNNLSVQTHTRETWGIKEETIREGEMKEVEKWEQGKVLRYRYKLQWPHSGIGVYIPF